MALEKTKSKIWIAVTGVILCVFAMILLIVQTLRTSPQNIWILVVMFGLGFLTEGIYREFRKKRKIEPVLKNSDSGSQKVSDS